MMSDPRILWVDWLPRSSPEALKLIVAQFPLLELPSEGLGTPPGARAVRRGAGKQARSSGLQRIC